MRVRTDDGREICTNCSQPWADSGSRCCLQCFCPDTHCTAVDDVALYQSGLMEPVIGSPLQSGALQDMKTIITEQLTRAVPPMTWEDLRKSRPEVDKIFGVA
jgi:hypothetical protein